jgi:2,3-diaminopropionate biosynthesis protein SbnA
LTRRYFEMNAVSTTVSEQTRTSVGVRPATGVLSAIGQTPLVRLDRVYEDLPIQIYAKLEMLNPGGSIKDRPAWKIIENAIEMGKIGLDTVVVESSSGNMAIGLAQACCYHGLRLICVVDPKTTKQNIQLLQAYGAKIEMVDQPDPVSGEYLPARLQRVQEILRVFPGSFWPNQYSNTMNSLSHHQTAREIVEVLEDKVDWLFVSTSTCGTLRGCSEYLRAHGLKTKVVAVDAQGSVIFGGPSGHRLIPGHGASIRPALLQDGLYDQCVLVSDLDCIVSCRRLAQREAILAGGSSGAVIAAVSRLAHQMPVDSNIVLLMPDRGERYLDTIYSDEWVLQHFGNVVHLWQTQP